MRMLARLRRLGRRTAKGDGKGAQEVRVTRVTAATTTWSGQALAFPQKNPQVVVSMYEIPPGRTLPDHEHPYLRYGYILSGTLRVTFSDTGQSKIFRAGDFGVESIGQWHRGETIGRETVRILVIDQVEEGRDNVTLRG